jgi:hypothetical protein
VLASEGKGLMFLRGELKLRVMEGVGSSKASGWICFAQNAGTNGMVRFLHRSNISTAGTVFFIHACAKEEGLSIEYACAQKPGTGLHS